MNLIVADNVILKIREKYTISDDVAILNTMSNQPLFNIQY